MKFVTERIHVLSDVFSLLSSRIFATMATWRDDFSSLWTNAMKPDWNGVNCGFWKLVSPRLRANGRNIVDQQLPTLLDVTCCVRLHTLLHVVGCCCALLRKVWNLSNFSANNSQHFFCSVITEAWRNNGGSVWTTLPTLLGSRICSLRMVYKDVWVVSFARCTVDASNVRSCCIRLHTTANTDATTPNIVGATMLGVVASVYMQPNSFSKFFLVSVYNIWCNAWQANLFDTKPWFCHLQVICLVPNLQQFY